MNTPIPRQLVDDIIRELDIQDFAKATIREVKLTASLAEKRSGVEFVKMEMGIPGLPAAQVGVDAQVKALQNGIASLYPNIQGLPELKREASRFVKAFIGLDVAPEGCIPVSGSMQGTFASFLTCSQCDRRRDTVLFIDPGFPVQKMQLQVMGVNYETFDVYDYRGERIGVTCISDALFHRHYPDLASRYEGLAFGPVFSTRMLYALSSGTSHSAQYALSAMLKAASDGTYDFRREVAVYGERARRLKEIFIRHGFYVVYDKDLDEPVADGFYFTIGYPGMTSGELARELMYYGVSAISLLTTGSQQEGLRVCTSFIEDHQYEPLDERMQIFEENHSAGRPENR